MSVAVISNTGERLMPTREYRARKLLKSGKAVNRSVNKAIPQKYTKQGRIALFFLLL